MKPKITMGLAVVYRMEGCEPRFRRPTEQDLLAGIKAIRKEKNEKK